MSKAERNRRQKERQEKFLEEQEIEIARENNEYVELRKRVKDRIERYGLEDLVIELIIELQKKEVLDRHWSC